MKLSRMSIDWPGFMLNADVQAMPVETRGVYLLLLGAMWMNGGWLPNDDKLIAKRLQMDVRAWRFHRKLIAPCLTEIATDIGSISVPSSTTLPCGMLVQDRLTREYQHTLDLVDKKRAQTGPARAKKAAKSKAEASATEAKSAPSNSASNKPSNKYEEAPVTATATAGEAEAEAYKKERNSNVGDYRGARANTKQDMIDHLNRSLERALQEEREQANDGKQIDHDRNDEPRLLEHRDEGRKGGDAGGPMDLSAIANSYRSGNG